MSRARAAMLLLAALAAAPALAAQDTTAVRRDTAAARADSAVAARGDTTAVRRRYPGPGGALWRSLLLPGWGQAALGRKVPAGIFIGLEGLTLGMAIKTDAELRELRRTGSPDADAKSKQREDWIVYLVANHLLAGLEAYVSAHLVDFPEDLQLRVAPGAVGASLAIPRIR